MVRSSGDVHPDASTLHAAQHRDEGQFDLFVNSLQFPALDLGAQDVTKAAHLLHVMNQGVVTRLTEERGTSVFVDLSEKA